jgi:hypothetical protein
LLLVEVEIVAAVSAGVPVATANWVACLCWFGCFGLIVLLWSCECFVRAQVNAGVLVE